MRHMNAKDGLANVHYVSRMTKMLRLTVIILANVSAQSICHCDITYLMKLKCLVIKDKILAKNLTYK